MTAPIYGLTPAMADCARVIAAMTDFDGNSPRFAEIAHELGTSTGGVHRLVICLIERGWVKPYEPRIKQPLRLTRSPPPFDYSAIAITEAGREYLEPPRQHSEGDILK